MFNSQTWFNQRPPPPFRPTLVYRRRAWTTTFIFREPVYTLACVPHFSAFDIPAQGNWCGGQEWNEKGWNIAMVSEARNVSIIITDIAIVSVPYVDTNSRHFLMLLNLCFASIVSVCLYAHVCSGDYETSKSGYPNNSLDWVDWANGEDGDSLCVVVFM